MKKYSHYMVQEIEIYGVNENCCANVLHVERVKRVALCDFFIELSSQSHFAINQLNQMKILR